MDFGFNDEQREIKSTAREFLADRFKPERVRELAESDSPYDDSLWREICELVLFTDGDIVEAGEKAEEIE